MTHRCPVEGCTIDLHRAYVAGALFGDAWCTPVTFGLRVKDSDFAEAFCRSVNAICKTAMSVRSDERGYWIVRASNKTGRFTHLSDFEPKTDAERGAWLRGLFDSEGNAQLTRLPLVGPNSWQRRIAMYSTDRATLTRAGRYLAALSVEYSVRPTKNSRTHKGTKTVFELRVCRRPSFQVFAHVVGSNIGRKQQTLERIAASFQPPGWQAVNWQKAIYARWHGTMP